MPIMSELLHDMEHSFILRTFESQTPFVIHSSGQHTNQSTMTHPSKTDCTEFWVFCNALWPSVWPVGVREGVIEFKCLFFLTADSKWPVVINAIFQRPPAVPLPFGLCKETVKQSVANTCDWYRYTDCDENQCWHNGHCPRINYSLWDIVLIIFIRSMFIFNSLRLRLNRRPLADDIFKCIFLNENEWILPSISLTFVLKVRMNIIPALVQIMAWRRPGDKPLSEPMMVSLLTHICITQPQWVNILDFYNNHKLCIYILFHDSKLL